MKALLIILAITLCTHNQPVMAKPAKKPVEMTQRKSGKATIKRAKMSKTRKKRKAHFCCSDCANEGTE